MIRKAVLACTVVAGMMLTATHSWAVDIPLVPVKHIANIQSVAKKYELGDMGYFIITPSNGGADYVGVLAWNDGTMVNLPWNNILTPVNGKLIIAVPTKNPSHDDVLLYDPATKTTVPYDFKYPDSGWTDPMLYYENGLILVGEPDSRGPLSHPALYDLQKGMYVKMHFAGNHEWVQQVDMGGFGQAVPSLSPDKMHAVVVAERDVFVIDVPEQRVVAKLDPKKINMTNARSQTQFISNSLILVGGREAWQLYNVDGKYLGPINFTLYGRSLSTMIFFSPDLRHAFELTEPTDYVDSTAFRNYIDKLGYLFHPTTGVMNEAGINFRQYPNLQAKVLGTLAKGEKVEVLDKSGSTEKIGPDNDFWYKLKTPDGTVGWAYGAFVDVAKNGTGG